MILIQTGCNIVLEPFYSLNIEELTKSNNDYRKVLYTWLNQQFVVMSIPPKDNIHIEIHKSHDQFIRIEQREEKQLWIFPHINFKIIQLLLFL